MGRTIANSIICNVHQNGLCALYSVKLIFSAPGACSISDASQVAAQQHGQSQQKTTSARSL